MLFKTLPVLSRSTTLTVGTDRHSKTNLLNFLPIRLSTSRRVVIDRSSSNRTSKRLTIPWGRLARLMLSSAVVFELLSDATYSSTTFDRLQGGNAMTHDMPTMSARLILIGVTLNLLLHVNVFGLSNSFFYFTSTLIDDNFRPQPIPFALHALEKSESLIVPNR